VNDIWPYVIIDIFFSFYSWLPLDLVDIWLNVILPNAIRLNVVMPNNIISFFYRNNLPKYIYHATLVYNRKQKTTAIFYGQKWLKLYFNSLFIHRLMQKGLFNVQRLGFCHFSSFSRDAHEVSDFPRWRGFPVPQMLKTFYRKRCC